MPKTVVIMNPEGIAAIDLRVRRVAEEVTEAVADDARRMAPEETSSLKRSVRVFNTPTTHRVYVGTDHWHFVEYGTRPHVIRPRVKQALYWQGALHPSARVNHPGATAHPYMRPAIWKPRRIQVLPGGRVVVY